MKLYDKRQLSETVGISVSTLDKLRRQGQFKLKEVHHERNRYFEVADIQVDEMRQFVEGRLRRTGQRWRY